MNPWHPRVAALVLLAMVGGAGTSVAQGGDFTLPASGSLPNYDRVPIGQREGLEAGAFVARTDDAAAGWFNPAGLALSEKSGLNASSNAYELTSITLEGFGTTKGSSRFSPVGTFLGGVLGEPIIKSASLRLGGYYAKPVSWTPGALDGVLEVTSPAQSEAISYGTSGIFVTIVPGVAAGYRLSQKIRVGAGLAYSMTTFNQAQTVGDRLLFPSSITTVLRSISTDGSTSHLLVSGGAQWDVTEHITVGGLLVSPGLRVGGSSKILYGNTGFTGAASRDLRFRDEEAKFEYQIPLRATVGIASRFGHVELEADLRYHAGTDPYTLFSSEVPGTLVSTDASGVPTQSTLAFAPITEQAKEVLNLAIGGQYRFSQSFRIHAGFFTDDSPVNNPATSSFRSVDLRGASAGVSFTGGHLSGSLGVSGSWGTTEDRAIGPSLGGLAALTKIKVTTFNLLYALSYAF